MVTAKTQYTRVRIGGARGERLTGNFAAALFTHDTSRALDPHLQTHCIVFNATFDPVEQRWKALENHELLRARKFAENIYYHELARDLRSFGYQIGNRARGDFHIEGIPLELCERFSKRHEQIDVALGKLLTDKPELKAGNISELRSLLAESERTRKQRTLSRDELQMLWDAQVAALNSLMAGFLMRASASSCPATLSHPADRKARRSITSCFPIPPSRLRPTRSNGM